MAETRSDTSPLRKELDDLRELFKQAKEQTQQAQDQAKIAQDLAQRQSELDKAKIDDLELAIRVAFLPSISSPVPNTNLLPTITAAAPIDEHRLNNAINEINREFDGKLNDLLHNITALIGSNVGNILQPVAPVSTGPQISFNLAACQSNAKASKCQVKPELSQS